MCMPSDPILNKLDRWEMLFKRVLKVVALLGVIFVSYKVGYKYGYDTAINFAVEYMKQMQQSEGESPTQRGI